MSFKILSTSPSFGFYSRKPVEKLENEGCTVVFLPQDQPVTEDLIREHVSDIDAMIVGVEPITSKVLEAAGRLKLIAKHGAGVDNVDVKYAKEKGIPVTNAPGTNSQAVADLTFALMLGIAREINAADQMVRKGQWPRIVGTELWQKTIGIIGLGQIGKLVATRAKGFDMSVLAYDVYCDHAYASEHGITFTSLETLLEQSDFVTVHIPYTAQTSNLIGKDQLTLMKKQAFICNLSRGGIIDENALYEALFNKSIAGAALDVFTKEPPGNDHPLFTLPNVLATPHMGAYTNEAMERVGMVTAENIVKVMKGKTPDFIVN